MLMSHDCIPLFFTDTFFLIGCFHSRPRGWGQIA